MRLSVLGAGESGVGTAILGLKKGYEVWVSDAGRIQDKYKEVLNRYGIAWEEGGHDTERILNSDVVMKSPGIPDKVALVQALVQKGIPVISEIEFAAPHTSATIVAITGSNGKTTTTSLTYHLLKEAGLHVGLGGNIGKSFAWQVAENDFDVYVLEISSFQLDGCYQFRPHIAIITNITPDHLDRYDYQFEKYIASKFRVTQQQTEDDYLIYDDNCPNTTAWLETHKVRAQTLPFSMTREPKPGAFTTNNQLFTITTPNDIFSMDLQQLALQGKHNQKNAMASASVAQLMKIRKETIRESLSNFQGVEHRLEQVLKIQQVQYINDSKATNVNATFFALESMKTPTVWIVGGVDKGNDYNELMHLVREKVKAIICLGVDNHKIIDAFGNVVDVITETQNMEEAVQMAKRLSEKGDSVLLSPACASFDLFENYEDRGRQFKEAVRRL